MIYTIELNNIQSHEHSVINLENGVNTIIGSSCAGKTAILRGLYWVIYNTKGASNILNSNWNKNSKGEPSQELSVTVTTENGWVKRYRNKESNGYIVHYNDGTEHKLEAVKTDVPDEVIKFLNVNDINVQKQMDSPFLLSESAPEAARYLNTIVHLDNIDTMLSKAEKNKRDVNSNISFIEKSLKENQEEYESLSIVDDCVNLIERIEKFDSQVKDIDSQMESIQYQITQFDNIKDFSKQMNLIDEIDSIHPEENNEEIARLHSEIQMFDNIKDFSKQMNLIDEIESIEIPDVSEFEDEIERFEFNIEKIKSCEKHIKELQDTLPSVCPLCGRPLEECNE